MAYLYIYLMGIIVSTIVLQTMAFIVIYKAKFTWYGLLKVMCQAYKLKLPLDVKLGTIWFSLVLSWVGVFIGIGGIVFSKSLFKKIL